MVTPNELLNWGSKLAGFDLPPADSCVVWGGDRPVTKLAASINATTGDLLLARELGCDGYLLHHPLAGSARREFHHVMDRMVELMCENGLNESKAREATAPLRKRLQFNDHASDWSELEAAAARIEMPLVNIHLPADELGRQIMVEAVREINEDASLDDLESTLRTIPELNHPTNSILRVSSDHSQPVGRIAVMHAGGTNGGAAVAKALLEHARVGTVIYIHLAGPDATEIESTETHLGHVVVTGHLASDAIGMNALMNEAKREFNLQFVPLGGLLPFTRS